MSKTKTPELIEALGVSDADQACALLRAGADPNETDDQGHTALHVYAGAFKLKSQDDRTVLALLIARGARPDVRDKKGMLPEELAGAFGPKKQWLCSYRARAALCAVDPSLHLSDVSGWTGLHWAAYEGDTQEIRRQLDRGASAGTQDYEGNIPIFHAAAQGHQKAVSILIDQDERSSWLFHKNTQKDNILHKAVAGGSLEIVRRIAEANSKRERGTDVAFYDAENIQQDTPLHLAARNGLVEILELMAGRVDRPGDLDAQGQNDCTPLMNAAGVGDKEACRVLVEAGADINFVGGQWKEESILYQNTPLAQAVFSGSAEIVQYFLEAGAELSSGVMEWAEKQAAKRRDGAMEVFGLLRLHKKRTEPVTRSSAGAEIEPDAGM